MMDAFFGSRKNALLAVLAVGVAGFSIWSLTRSDEAAPPDRSPVRKAVVARVISGNRIKTDQGESVIYAGIRAPYKDEPLGQEAFELNRRLVEGKKIHMRFGESQRDAKGRWMAFVFVGGTLLNTRLVEEGLAYVRLRPGQQRYAKVLLAAQDAARKARRGLWKRPHRSDEKSYVGDRKHGLFHRSACLSAANTRPENAVTFTSRQAAFDAGFAPCERCDP